MISILRRLRIIKTIKARNTSTHQICVLVLRALAEGKGFEPMNRLPYHWIIHPVQSAPLATLKNSHPLVCAFQECQNYIYITLSCVGVSRKGCKNEYAASTH